MAETTTTTPGHRSSHRDLDPDVVQRFTQGDVDALGQIYDRFARPVWSIAMRVLNDRHLAEDAVNEVFMRIWKTAATFDPARPMAPWLFTVARRTALDVYRREFRPTRGAHEEETDVGEDQPGIEHAWEAWEIQLALEQLNDEERQIIRMAHFEGLTQTEVAERLSIPVGTVKSKSHRAHRRLASLLRHLVPAEGAA